MTLQTQRVQTLEQVRAFVEGSEAVDFAGDDRAGVYALVRRTLVKLCVRHTYPFNKTAHRSHRVLVEGWYDFTMNQITTMMKSR